MNRTQTPSLLVALLLSFLLPSRGTAQSEPREANRAEVAPSRFVLHAFSEYARLDAGADLRTATRREQSGFGIGLRLAHRPVSRIDFGTDLSLSLTSLGGVSDLRIAGDGASTTGQRSDLALADLGARFWVGVPLRASVRGELAVGVARRASERWADDGLVDRGALRPTLGMAVSRTLPWKGAVFSVGLEHVLDGLHEVEDSLGSSRVATPIRGSGGRGFVRMSVPLEYGRWLPATSAADDTSGTVARERLARPMLEFTIENDTPTSDRAYTNGVRLQLHEVPLLHRAARLVGSTITGCVDDTLPTREGSVTCLRSSVSLHQTMYTPVEQYDDTVQLRDRPFAGILFAGARWEVLHRRFLSGTSRLRWYEGDAAFALEGQGGVLGPMAQARETQRMAHWAVTTGSPRPNGWDFQTSNRPYVQALAEAWVRPSVLTGAWLRDRFNSVSENPSLGIIDGADVSINVAATVGTVFHRASIGAFGRWSHSRYRLPGSPFVRSIDPQLMNRISMKDERPPSSRASGPSAHAGDSSSASASAFPWAPGEVYSTPRFRYALTWALLHRATVRNETITGGHEQSSADLMPRTTSAPDIALAAGFREARLGLEVELMRFRVGVLSIWRGREFRLRSGPNIVPTCRG